ncbi:MAG: hypothetical protein IPK85_14180 [Gemmatimonadetes bacterium]|nr:hypothetical protein [Gemmatimonadota bacterium]
MTARHGVGLLLLLVGCARAEQPANDTATVAATEPEILTDADTLGRQPEPPVFQLIGTEPFWGLRIDSNGMIFTTPVDTAGEQFPPSTPVLVGDTLRWNSLDSAGHMVEAIVITAPCSDGMSDKRWSHRARLTIGGDLYEGCAERRAPRRQ